ncbi:MAG: hypothetical protein GY809_07290, partial [Planctomycetes bacterium]|nr:hypothetical protein [Planctomycetota bacterium]
MKTNTTLCFMLLASGVVTTACAQAPVSIKGVFPHMTVYAHGAGSTSETGIGAMIPWADKLWAVGYVAHVKGSGIGLYETSDDMTMTKHPASVT